MKLTGCDSNRQMNPPAVGSDSKMAEVYARGLAKVIQSQRTVVERWKVLVEADGSSSVQDLEINCVWDFIFLILCVGVTPDHDWEHCPWTFPP